jgi:DNA-binding NarL/FixJ family response regulator
MIDIILADDHAMLREGLRRKFDDMTEFHVVGEAGSAAELMTLLPLSPHPVILLDIKLPDESGLRLIPRIKKQTPRSRVIILTMFNHVRYLQQAIEVGADGFVVKGAPFAELIKAVHEVVNHRIYVCSEMVPHLATHIHRPSKGSALEGLSDREFEVLTLLTSGLTPQEVGERLGINSKTVGTYRHRLMEKLELDSTADLVRFALENGIIS